MKKLWIWILSGLAFLLGSVALVRCVHREQPCYYGPPIKDPAIDTIEMNTKTQRRQQLQQRLDSIRDILQERLNAEVYGSPEIMEEYGRETRRLKAEADSLANELEEMDIE